MKEVKISNGINIQVQLTSINIQLFEEKIEEVCFKIPSYESIKHKYQKGKFQSKITLPLFYLFRRIIPNLPIFNHIQFFRSKRILTLAEILGRIYFGGFEIKDYHTDGEFYSIKTRRINEAINKVYKNEGLIIKLERIGKNGKIIYVYKLRTMHPYSEYIQEFLFKKYGFSKSGKIKNDIRLTTYGRFLRKYYLDEIPQLLNLLKGDLKIIGVRPVSGFYLNSLPNDLQTLRYSLKPGCIPPYVSEGLKASFENAYFSELKYIEKFDKKPFLTDFIYFWKAIYNILFKFIRSQ